MKHVLCFFLVAGAAFGQFTIANPSAQSGWSCTGLNCTARWRQGFPDTPYPQAYSITGTASSLAQGSCSGNATLCTSLTFKFCTVGSDPCSATNSSPATLYVYFDGYNNSTVAAGSYTLTTSVRGSTSCNGAASCTIQITYVANAVTASAIQTLSGTTNECSGSRFGYPDICNFLPDWPLGLGGTFTFPTPPGTYTDGNFGGTVRVLTAATAGAMRVQPFDAIVRATNANNTLVATLALPGGVFYLTDAITGRDTYTSVPPMSAWDGENPNVYWNFGSNLKVVKETLMGGNVVRSTTWYTYTATGGATRLVNSTDGDVTQDGWLSLLTQGGTDQKLVLINLNTGPPATAYTIGVTYNNPRLTQALGGCDAVTNKRYIIVGYLNAVHPQEVYSFDCGTKTMAFEFIMPMVPAGPYFHHLIGPACQSGAASDQKCQIAGHNATAMVNGQAYYVPTYQSQHPYGVWVVYMRLNVGINLALPVEAGGGMTIGPQIAGTGDDGDIHIGCSDVGACVISRDSDPGIGQASATQFSDALTAVDNTTPIVAHYLSAGLSSLIANGQSIVLGGVQGTCAKGVNGIAWTVANLNTAARTFQLLASRAQGACTSNTGGLVRNAHPAQTSNQTAVWLVDARNIANKAFTITRLPNSRSFAMWGNLQLPGTNGLGGQYWQQAHCTISRDGSLLSCNAGNQPDTVQVIGINTGFQSTQRRESRSRNRVHQ